MQTAARTSDADAVAGQIHPSFLVVDASHGIIGPQPPTLRQTNFDERSLHKACMRLNPHTWWLSNYLRRVPSLERLKSNQNNREIQAPPTGHLHCSFLRAMRQLSD